jgi:hypothetical protein
VATRAGAVGHEKAIAARCGPAGLMALVGLAALALAASGCTEARAQSQPRPAIKVAATIEAQAAGSSQLQIQVLPAHLVPRQAFLRIRGLPPTIALSDGHSIAVGAWAVPLSALPRLRIDVPTGTEGSSEITILLVSADGSVLDQAKSTLLVVPQERAGATPSASPQASALRMEPERPPAPPVKSQLASADRDRALKMLQRGNELIAARDFSAAQHFFKRAAEIGLPEAALALARTFDPGELARLGAVGLRPDPQLARNWYEKARALGSTEADEFLLRLSAAR